MKLPNAPRTPALLQVCQWPIRPRDFLDACTKHYGDIFTVQFPGSEPTVYMLVTAYHHRRSNVAIPS